jgi:hypothetical protein
MRRLIVLMMALTMVIASGAVASATSNRCTRGDVEGLTSAGFQGAKHALVQGLTVGSGDAWSNCQFRLYDDNDDPNDSFFGPMVDNPEVPHIYTDEDYFLAGIFHWATEDDLEVLDISRNEAISVLKIFEDRFFWGPKGSELEEIPLTHTNYRSLNSIFGWLVVNHRYHIFEPGSLAVGEYEWRWETWDPFQGPFVAHGDVNIIDG